MKKLMLFLAAALLLNYSVAMAAAKDRQLKPEDIKAIAVSAVQKQGIVLKEVDVIYDEGGKIWLQRSGIAAIKNDSSNYGILKNGFLKNYRIVLFDFRDPVAKDVWVFIDKDTGDVLTVYKER